MPTNSTEKYRDEVCYYVALHIDNEVHDYEHCLFLIDTALATRGVSNPAEWVTKRLFMDYRGEKTLDGYPFRKYAIKAYVERMVEERLDYRRRYPND